jgi:hypothetical protein
MSTTDQQLLNEVQYASLETPNSGASWPSGLWSADEIASYLNLRQRRLLYETGCVCKRGTLITVPNELRYPLPADWIQTRRAMWLDPGSGVHPLLRSEIWYLDYGLVSWEETFSKIPLVYMDDVLPTLEVQIAPASSDGGVLQLLYVAIGAALSNTGVAITVPDDLVPILKWGVLAEMFGKVGRAHDPEKAAYCEERFALGCTAATFLFWGADSTGGGS